MPDSRPPLTADPGPADPLARALAALRPSPSGLDERALLYRAGQASRDGLLAAWRWVVLAQFGLLLVAGAGAAVLFARLDALDRMTPAPVAQPAPGRVPDPRPPGPEAAPPPRPAAAPPASPAAPPEYAGADVDPDEIADYLRRRREVLTAGLGVLPGPGPKPPRTTGPAEVERSLGLPPGVLAAPHRPTLPKSPD
ncbi:MAG: hypothetical protein U0871_12615 [Gemmataceae bacterium]